VNYDEMDGDRLRLSADRNCYMLSRVSWAFSNLLLTIVNNYNLHSVYGVALVAPVDYIPYLTACKVYFIVTVFCYVCTVCSFIFRTQTVESCVPFILKQETVRNS